MRTFATICIVAVSFAGFGTAGLFNGQAIFTDNLHTSSPPAGVSFKNCGSQNDAIQIRSVEVFPNPPNPGQDLTVTVEAEVLETVEEGAYADVVVKLGLIKILTKSFDLCEEARNAKMSVQCPVQPGTYKVEQKVALPKEVPPAKFMVAVEGYTVDDDSLMCLNIVADFMKRPF